MSLPPHSSPGTDSERSDPADAVDRENHGPVSRPITHPDLAFQCKLESYYASTYRRLWRWRDLVTAGQEVLVWRKPLASTLLYVGLHWGFVILARFGGSFLSMLGTLLLLVLFLDIFYRAATSGAQEPPPPSRSRRGSARERRDSEIRVFPFEEAVSKMHMPHRPQELMPFPVLCLKVARVLTWANTLFLALRQWSINQPLIFSLMLAGPGLALCFVGHYIPTIVLLYITVMGCVIWPYVEYSQLRSKVMVHVQTHHPAVIQRAEAAWLFLTENSIAKDDDDSGGDFDFVLEEEVGEQRGVEEEQEERGDGEREDVHSARRDTGDTRHSDPNFSIAEDSILGLQPHAFEGSELDSLSNSSLLLAPGDFPSITNLDLMSFTTPGGRNLNLTQQHSAMPPIGEGREEWEDEAEVEIELGHEAREEDYDPFTESMDAEFGFNFTDAAAQQRVTRPGRHGQWPQPRHAQLRAFPQQPHPLSTSLSVSDQFSSLSPHLPPPDFPPPPSAPPPQQPPSYDEVMAYQDHFPQSPPSTEPFPSGYTPPVYAGGTSSTPVARASPAVSPENGTGMRLRNRQLHRIYPDLGN